MINDLTDYAALILVVAVLAALACLVTGCTTPIANPLTTAVNNFTLKDAQACSAWSKLNNDTAGQKCCDYIAAQVAAANAAPSAPGVLYLNEVKRTQFITGTGLAQACGGVLPLVIAP